MRRLRLALAVGLAASVTALAGGAQPAAAAAPAEDFFGVNVGMVMNLAPEERDAHLAKMAANGLKVVRQDASWIGAEPQAPDAETGEHHYDWSGYDTTAAAFAAQGLRWYPILDYSTNWSAEIPDDPMSAPAADRLDDFAAYARAFAQRYGEGGAFWAEHPELPTLPVAAYEIWNEENANMFWRQQDSAPEVYSDLYTQARSAIREVDTATPVVVGGLLDANATDPNTFLRRMVARHPELRTDMDAVGYHPYQQSYDGIISGIGRLRATLRGLGAGPVPIEITEVGITTSWISEETRASVMSRLARQLPDDSRGVTRFMPYVWASSDQGDGPDGYWGMVRLDGTEKPTATAYLAAVRGSSGDRGSAGPSVRVKKKTKKKRKRARR